MKKSVVGNLTDELRLLVGALGDGGGIVSPSIYDTAQILRLNPEVEGTDPALAWLLDQQQPDGGWGHPDIPAERTIPTLAAMLTLKTHRAAASADAIAAGLAFLEAEKNLWRDIHIDLVPIAAEMIVPYLLDEAEQLGLLIDRKPYALLYEMRRRKLERLATVQLQANTAPTFSWEALGLPFTVDVFDANTGVGHSPAATAAWLKQARIHGVDASLCAYAENYLARAHAATESDIPGLYPVVYPIRGFELTYGLYALMLTGLMDHPALESVVAQKLQDLADIVQPGNGISFGEGFVPDVDDTGVAVTVLRAAGFTADPKWVRRFWHEDHFYTYANELNPSVFSNAHALHALTQCDDSCDRTEAFLLERQSPNGHWLPDKWHTSWRSTTMEAVAALAPLGNRPAIQLAVDALCRDQRQDGSWGDNDAASSMETAYSVITLQLARQHNDQRPVLEKALEKARRWYLRTYDTDERLDGDDESRWLGKVVYSPRRVDQVYDLSVRLRMRLDDAASTERQGSATLTQGPRDEAYDEQPDTLFNAHAHNHSLKGRAQRSGRHAAARPIQAARLPFILAAH